MTVIRPNSISGINSITGNGGDISIFRADGTAADVTVNNITSGVITATTFKGAVEGNITGNISGATGAFTTSLGIGGVTPARELHVHSPDSGSTYIALTNTTSGTTNGDGFAIGLGGDEVARIWNYENTNMEIATNNGKRLEIDTDGGITQTSIKAFQIAKGTTGERPTGVVGMIRFNTTTDRLENYNSSGWQNVNVKVPVISSITGNIYAGMATNLTITGTDFDATVTVIFKEGSTTKATLTNQSVSSGSLTVAVPSAVYGESAGDTITITITNADGVVSAGSNKTIQTAPSGGTITTSGNYRIHSFTSVSYTHLTLPTIYSV